MTDLRIENWVMPAANLGSENPLPTMQPSYDSKRPTEFPGIPETMAGNMARGRLEHYLPYTIQDQYKRKRQDRAFKVAVLENEILRATFLLELGGRLWSIIHKASGRELLDVNSVFQPANLAMRNAWFAGGVEWNIGAIAHSPFTCAPIFAARVEAPDGMPILRLYEWERIREVAFQIDAYLPPDSPVLFLRMRITNAHEQDIPMYWWSNIAVPETEDTRVLVPAKSAYRFTTERDGLDVVPIPIIDGNDVTYPTRSAHTVDYFFDLPQSERPWITALDGTGKGLIQFSSDNLIGRKLFIWGQGTGGKNWQEFLSEPGHAYLEIQAGLAKTQLEHLLMPAKTDWSWLEGYGLIEADSDTVHGENWEEATLEVENKLEGLISFADFKAEYEHSATWIDTPPGEILHRGTGWGTLEAIRRKHSDEALFCSDALVFDDEVLTEAQTPWIELLQHGTFPQFELDAKPQGYVVSETWRELLEKALVENSNSGWMAWMHLGVMRYAVGERNAARQAWEQSNQQTENAYALRNLAALAQQDGLHDRAVELYLKACKLDSSLLPLIIETGGALLAANRPQQWLDFLEQLAKDVQQIGRIRLLEGEAALAVGDFERVQRIFDDEIIVVDLREGERSLSQLWLAYHAKRLTHEEGKLDKDMLRERVRREFPIPKAFDFRMSERDN